MVCGRLSLSKIDAGSPAARRYAASDLVNLPRDNHGGSIGVCVRLDRILHVLALLNVDRSEGPKGMAQGLTMKTHSRRDLLLPLTKAVVLGISGTAGVSGLSFATPLDPEGYPRRVNRSAQFRMVPRCEPACVASDATYRAAIIANCQFVVPEGEMKWPDIHPARDQYRFEKADALVDFARQNNIGIRGHTLAWYGGMPAWTASIRAVPKPSANWSAILRRLCPDIGAPSLPGTWLMSRWSTGRKRKPRFVLRSGPAGWGRTI